MSLSSRNSMSVDSEGKAVDRVSMHDENATRVSDDDSSGVDLVSSDDAGELQKASSKNAEHGQLYREKGQSGNVPGDKKREYLYHKKAAVSNGENDSMLSISDDYAENGKSPRAGHGYEAGDMVWGKVKSHPWWPGHVFNEVFATSSVRKSKTEGHVLVAFFGDSSYGWFEPTELIPFEPNFTEKSRQTTSRTFIKAVEDAVDELNKRRSLGFACRCRNPYSFRPTKVKDYLAVDFSDNETGVFSVSQIRKARDSFVPDGMLKFLKDLALKPMNGDRWSIHFIQEKASYLAFRKAVYEEFDETYSQAFGTHSQRPGPAKAPLEPSRATMSGRLVFAETLGKVKSPRKHSKPKDQSAKDKYVLKRRDDHPNLDPKTVENSHEKSGTCSQPSSDTTGSDLEVKEPHADVARLASQATSPESPSQTLPQSNANEIVHDNLSDKQKLQIETTNVKTDSEVKKAKAPKRLLGDVDSEGKTKKGKKNLAKETKLDPTDNNTIPMLQKLPGPQVYPVREDHQNNNQENDSMLQQVELPQLLDELRDLALDPFYGFEKKKKKSYANVWKVFMNFRSLVYLKSPYIDPKEARPSILSSENKIPEKYKVMSSSTTKRPPSDRLEEVAVKKKKKINHVKLLAAEKRAALKNQEPDNNNNNNTHKTASAPSFPTSVPGSEPVKKKVPPPFPPPAKASGRMMMLVMKFPAEAALPSGAELRAKFARFGPMDYNATRIFYTTLTCRVVYHRKTDAEAALNFARSNFGGMNVRCYLREKDNEAEEPPHITTPAVALKSILKKPPDGSGGGGVNGGRSSVSKGRVKFILSGGEDEAATATSHGFNNNYNNNNNNTDKFQMASSQFPFAPSSNVTKKPEIQTPPINVVVAHGGGGGGGGGLQPPPNIDIREQMSSLLSRCEGIMKTLEGSIGYVPFHL